MLCQFCGWGDHIRTACMSSIDAERCYLNKDNVRKFCLRFKNEPPPNIVRSIRYQGPDGKGDSYEFLERIE